MPTPAHRPVPPRASLVLGLLLLPLGAAAGAAAGATPQRALPVPSPLTVALAFEENRGQTAPEVDFLSRGNGYTLFLAGGEATFVFGRAQRGAAPCTLRLRFEGARPGATAQGELPQAGRSNYLSLDGSRPAIADVPRVGRVRYPGILPGTDLLFYGREGRLEYDLELAPGAAGPPVLALEGASSLAIGDDGALAIDTCGMAVAFEPPIAYQPRGEDRLPVSARYRLLSAGRATFELGPSDPALPLVLDPVFSYSTCLAGSGSDYAADLALGPGGEIYVAGYTTSADFPTRNPIHGYGGGFEAFVTKLNAAGTDVVYSTYAGNNADHQIAMGVAVNGAGEAFVAGNVSYASGAPSQAFLLKLNASGNGVGFSSVFGGSANERANEVALDSAGNAVVAGFTESADFAVLNAYQATHGGSADGFVRRYSPTGTLLSSTYLGGANDQVIDAVAVGPGDNIFVGGRNHVTDFFGNAWVVKLNASASAVVYGRQFGGSGSDWGLDLAVDAGSRAYLVGSTNSTNFPVSNAIQAGFGGNSDAFLTVLDSAGSASFVTSTYLGDADAEIAEGVALGPGGDVFITGSDGGSGTDVFLLQLSAAFNAVNSWVRLGPGGGGDTGKAVRVDASGAAYVVGTSNSGGSFPTTPGAFQACFNGGANAFAAKIVDGTPQLSVVDVSTTEGNAGSQAVSFAVWLSQPPLNPVTFSWATANGTATAPADYQAASGSGRTIAAGNTVATVDVTVNGDALDETNETFTLDVSSVVGATVADGQGVATIADDDPTPTLSVGDCALGEGTGGTTGCTFTVALSAPSALTVTVAYTTADGTAAAPGDYGAASGMLTFNPGETSKSVTVTVVGDALDENDETFGFNLFAPSNAYLLDSHGDGSIIDDDAPPSLAINDCALTEGNGGATSCTFTVSLTAPTSFTVSVAYATADGSAVSSSDYGSTSGTLTFSPGQTSKTVDVPVFGDTVDENDEAYRVNLGSPTNAGIADSVGDGTIADDDGPPALAVNDVTVTEGNSGAVTATFTVTLSAVSGKTVTVNWATANGTAAAPGDYTAASGSLTFSPGQTSRTLGVAVQGDTTDEPDETFSVGLSSPGNATVADGTGVGTITDDDAPPPVGSLQLASATASVGEGGGTITLTVTRTAGTNGNVSVTCATVNGTATQPGDYTQTSATLSWVSGDATPRSFVVPIVDDAISEGAETFLVSLTNPTGGATLGAPASTQVTILDDETAIRADGFESGGFGGWSAKYPGP